MKKPKPDEAHVWTEKGLAALEKRIETVYKEARDSLDDTIREYFEKFKQRDEEMKQLIGTIQHGKEWTEADYKQWRLNQIARGKRYQALRDKIAERYTKANETAIAYVNDATPGIYSLNRNYSAYTIDRATGGALTIGDDGETLNADFTLYDEQTVKRLVTEQPDVMPYYPPKRAVKRGIDLAYGKDQITKNVTSGILQGLGVGQIADRLQERMEGMSRTSALRAARTGVTAAQNAGRMDSYRAAQKMGIRLRKQWLSTLDGRTRHSHQMIDGEIQEVEKPFSNGCMHPGDPRGKPAETYNCRCTLVSALDVPGLDPGKRRARNPVTGKTAVIDWTTYPKWEQSIRAMEEKTVASGGERGIINTKRRDDVGKRAMAMGLRRPVSHVLTDAEIAELKQEAESIEVPVDKLIFNSGPQTGFRDRTEMIYIRGDVLPDPNGNTMRDTMTSRAVLAHEYYGHYKSHPSEYEPGDWRDEFRASYNAAVNTPNLTDEERAQLMIDAYDRAKEAGEFHGYDAVARRIIYGY